MRSSRHILGVLLLAVLVTSVFVPLATPTAAATPDVPIVQRDRSWIIRDGSTFTWGRSRDVHLMGDWDGDGVATQGLFRNGHWYLRNRLTSGSSDVDFVFGRAGDVPVVGDWDGNGTTTVGVVRGTTWRRRNRNSAGDPCTTFSYGRLGDVFVTGDGNANGRTSIGVVRGNEWRLRNSRSAGDPSYVFTFGRVGDRPVVGDWNGSGRDTVGMVRGTTWRLRNELSAGSANQTFRFGQCGEGALSTGGSQTAPQVPTNLRGTEWTRLPTTDRVVALTFDGGANKDGLASILRTLEDTGTPATFFLTGDFATCYPTSSRTIAAYYPIGNHTQTHPDLTTLSDADVRAEIIDAHETIRQVTGREPRPWFRFPFGARDSRTIGLANCRNHGSVRWTVDTLGWQGTSGGRSAASVRQRVLDNLEPGTIVLIHVGSNPQDGSTLDADALPTLLARTRERGYTFVTLTRYG